MQEKINRINNNLYEDDPNKYKKIVKSEAYSFMSDCRTARAGWRRTCSRPQAGRCTP